MRLFRILILFSALILGIWACSQDDDGPLDLSSSNQTFGGKGFFKKAVLDSGSLIYLAGDTLHIYMDSIWTFSNCALKRLGVDASREDSVLVLKPYFDIEVTDEDCAAPLYRPDTILKYYMASHLLAGISMVQVKNDADTVLDSILVRRGKLTWDTIRIYVDSLFDSVHSLPLRTEGSPSVVRVLDSITPRTFVWRTMKSNCGLRIDNCDSVVTDTLFPSSWRLDDTTLVPVHYACADTDLVYCHSNRWENDSTDLGKLQERPDTIWHTSTYYVESIPECGAVDKFSRGSFYIANEFVVTREVFERSDSEPSCGPSTTKELFVYDIGRNHYVADTVDVDSLVKAWKSAKVAKSAKSK
jgi:hypothetical protein